MQQVRGIARRIAMERIKQDMTGYRMPAYIEEILTQNYCDNFMRMSILRDNGSYSFSYKPGNLNKLDPDSMSLYDKLLLLDLKTICSSRSWYMQEERMSI